jgi:hypothetical protein
LIPNPVAGSALSTGTEASEVEKLANQIDVVVVLDWRHQFILLHSFEGGSANLTIFISRFEVV